jgi:hypothetical protein
MRPAVRSQRLLSVFYLVAEFVWLIQTCICCRASAFFTLNPACPRIDLASSSNLLFLNASLCYGMMSAYSD